MNSTNQPEAEMQEQVTPIHNLVIKVTDQETKNEATVNLQLFQASPATIQSQASQAINQALLQMGLLKAIN